MPLPLVYTCSSRDRCPLWPCPGQGCGRQQTPLLRARPLCAGTWPAREETEAGPRPRRDGPAPGSCLDPWALLAPAGSTRLRAATQHLPQARVTPSWPSTPPTATPLSRGPGATRVGPHRQGYHHPEPGAPGGYTGPSLGPWQPESSTSLLRVETVKLLRPQAPSVPRAAGLPSEKGPPPGPSEGSERGGVGGCQDGAALGEGPGSVSCPRAPSQGHRLHQHPPILSSSRFSRRVPGVQG